MAPSHWAWTGSAAISRSTHHELLHADGEGCRVEQDLPVLGQEANDILDEHHKILRQQLIRLKGYNAIRHDELSSDLRYHQSCSYPAMTEDIHGKIHIYLIHHHHLDSVHLCHSLLYQVQDPTRRGDDHMH